MLLQCVEMQWRILQASTFDGIISKFRDSSVASALFAARPVRQMQRVCVCSLLTFLLGLSGLWFFKDDNKEDEKFLDEYNKASRLPNTDPGLVAGS